MEQQLTPELTDLAARFGLRPTRILQSGPGRTTLQAQRPAGELFVLKTTAAGGELAGDVDANRLLARQGLPVPEIVAYADGAPSVLVLRWIDGEPISSASPAPAQQHVGRILRTVHALPGGPPFSGQPTILGWITAWTDELVAWWPSAGGTAAQVARLRGWLDDLAPVLAGRTGSLTLFDGRAEHFLVREGHVAGLIDLHDLGPGDPAMDLAVIGLTDQDLMPGVMSGYGALGTHDPGGTETDELELIGFYLLLRRLAAADWLQRTGRPAEGRRLLELASELTDRR